MKINVKLNKEEQKTRQTEAWSILASTLPPAPKKSLMRILIAGGLIVVAIAVFIVVAVNKLETTMVVLAVIVLIAGVFTLSGALFDLLSKKRRTKRLTAEAAASVDAMFGELAAATEAEFDFGATEAGIIYKSVTGETIRHATCKLSECGVTAIIDTLLVDFTDNDAYCFTAAEIGKDQLLELKKILLAKHESYRDVACDEHGRYYITGADL